MTKNPAPQLPPLRALLRLLRVLGCVLGGAWVVWRRFAGLDLAQREAEVQRWAQRMLVHLGVQLQRLGPHDVPGPLLLVCNHISWLDILVLLASRPCRFVSKAEVRHWPLIGALADAAGTLFIERASRRDALRVVHQMADCLKQGEVLAVFPEGTTSDGQEVLPFHANLLQAALAVKAPVQPLGLRYREPGALRDSLAPTYVGDETLLQSLWRTLRTPALQAQLRFGEAEASMGRDRRTWAGTLHQSVCALRS